MPPVPDELLIEPLDELLIMPLDELLLVPPPVPCPPVEVCPPVPPVLLPQAAVAATARMPKKKKPVRCKVPM
jgi:hypothetical protein